MAGEILTADEVFSGEEIPQVPSGEGKKIVSADEVFGTGTGSDKPTPVVTPVPDKHRVSTIQALGMRLYAGMLSGAADFNSMLAKAVTPPPEAELKPLPGAAPMVGLKEIAQAGREKVAELQAATIPENTGERIAFGLAESLGNLGTTLPVDIMAGSITKMALVGRILPEMEAILSRIPDFALGSGWKGLNQGIEESGNPIEGAYKGIVGAAENVAINTLYANAGVGLKGIGKMASLGLASSIYEAAKEGRPPTKEEMIDGATHGAAMGFIFTVIPHIIEGTKIGVEKSALRKYQGKIEEVIGREGPIEFTAEQIKSRMDLKTLDLQGKSGVAASHPFGEPTTELGQKLITLIPKGYDQLKALSMASTDIAVRRDARKLLGILSDRVEDNFKFQKLADFQPESMGPETEIFKNIKAKLLTQAVAGEGTAAIKDPSNIIKIVDDLLHDEAIRPEIRRSLAQPFLDMLEQRGSLVAPELKVGDWKDAGTLSLLRETMERTLDKITRTTSDAKPVKEFTTERVKENETYRAKWLTTYRQMFQGKMKEWGIKPNSLDDKLVQRYGEGNATIAAVQVDSPKNWQNVVEASKWFREQYDGLLEDINIVRARYDYEPIPKRADYFRHFQELTAASQTFGLLLGGAKPPTSIAGIVRRPKSGKPFTPVEMKRLGGEYTESAIGGFNNYIQVASKQLFHTDSVQRMRMLDNYIRGQAESNDHIDLSNFMVNLRDYTDILAGQPADIDRSIQRTLGRPTYAVLRWLDKKTAANMIGANISAAITNNIVFTQSFATMNKVPALKGLFHSVMDSFSKDKHTFKIDGVESDLWTRRYAQQKINMTFGDMLSGAASGFFDVVDQFSVKAIISGKNFEGRSQGLDAKQAMKAADDYTSKLVTDRSIGQLPVIMESKGLRVITRFQTEVNNMASFLIKDVPEMYHGDVKKIAGALTQFAVYSWVFNNLFEEVTGRRPTIDPIYMLATLTGINKSGRGRPFTERLAPAAKDFVGQIPFGNLLVEGGRFPVTAGVPDVNAMLDKPTLGTAVRELSKPLFYLAPPFGGGQIKKTLGGMVDFAKGVSETPSGDERYGIHRDIRNFMQGFLFGGNAFPEAVKYWSQPNEDR